jgi:hypothetical protein
VSVASSGRDEVARLLELLDEAAALLERHGDVHWGAWLSRDAERIRAGDLYGVTHLLEAFGGMGSLGDVTFDPADHEASSEEEAREATLRLRALTGEAHWIATALRREAEGS